MKSQSGQTLLEILISLAIVTIVLVAIVSRATESIRNTNFSRNKVLAARFAQEGVEWAREQRDRMGWTDFENLISTVEGGDVTYCVLVFSESLSCRLTSCSNITIAPCTGTIGSTIFNREIRFIHVDPDALDQDRVTAQVTVSWSDSIGTHNSQYETVFSEWQL
jgi:type II secretory pathway pseudopilin PulG